MATSPDDEAAAQVTGEVRRFHVEGGSVRGVWTRLDGPWQQVCSRRTYLEPVRSVVGESLAAGVLLAATLKFRGLLTLQLQGDGPLPLVVATCSDDYGVRALARPREDAKHLPHPGTLPELVGSGQMTVTIQSEGGAGRYQGVVPLIGTTLAACLDNYFATSEQLPTRLRLCATADSVVGMLLQRLPAEGGTAPPADAEDWPALASRLGALEIEQLLAGTAEDLAASICMPHDVRLMPPTAVRFVCRCGGGRIDSILRSLGARELNEILAQEGVVTVTCEFCGREHPYDANAVAALFLDDSGPPGPLAVN